jgi:hypothetical protein
MTAPNPKGPCLCHSDIFPLGAEWTLASGGFLTSFSGLQAKSFTSLGLLFPSDDAQGPCISNILHVQDKFKKMESQQNLPLIPHFSKTGREGGRHREGEEGKGRKERKQRRKKQLENKLSGTLYFPNYFVILIETLGSFFFN